MAIAFTIKTKAPSYEGANYNSRRKTMNKCWFIFRHEVSEAMTSWCIFNKGIAMLIKEIGKANQEQHNMTIPMNTWHNAVRKEFIRQVNIVTKVWQAVNLNEPIWCDDLEKFVDIAMDYRNKINLRVDNDFIDVWFKQK